ncbi:MAG: polysaccharide export protein [Verrucomicrobia bacterium]|jgi:polysaccharide export outer membrane protein|nr:polysaccharide export protein [Verrucomicrobiota bacterium]
MTLSTKRLRALLQATAAFILLAVLTGCQTTSPEPAFQEYDATASVATASGAAPQESASSVPPQTRSGGGYSDTFQVGDVVAVTFSGTSENIPPHEERIKEDGTITLFLINSIQAAGKTPGELQRELQAEYNKYYKTLVVTVRTFSRFYYVGGEVKRPGTQEYLGQTSVTKAIQAAGDFTDFAKKNRIRVIRNDGTSLTVNFSKLIDDPSLDPPIYPGDKIHVPRRILW